MLAEMKHLANLDNTKNSNMPVSHKQDPCVDDAPHLSSKEVGFCSLKRTPSKMCPSASPVLWASMGGQQHSRFLGRSTSTPPHLPVSVGEGDTMRSSCYHSSPGIPDNQVDSGETIDGEDNLNVEADGRSIQRCWSAPPNPEYQLGSLFGSSRFGRGFHELRMEDNPPEENLGTLSEHIWGVPSPCGSNKLALASSSNQPSTSSESFTSISLFEEMESAKTASGPTSDASSGMSLIDRIQEDFPRTPSPVYDLGESFDKQTGDISEALSMLQMTSAEQLGNQTQHPHRYGGERGDLKSLDYRPFVPNRAPLSSHRCGCGMHGCSPGPKYGGIGTPPYVTPVQLSNHGLIPSREWNHAKPLHCCGHISSCRAEHGTLSSRQNCVPKSHYCGDRSAGIYEMANIPEDVRPKNFPSIHSFRWPGHQHRDRMVYPEHSNRFPSPQPQPKMYGGDRRDLKVQGHSYNSQSLLDEFRQTGKSRSWELSTIKGHLSYFAKDQGGSRFIQLKLESADERTRNDVFDEIFPDAFALMMDVFGNYVIQKLLEYGNENQKHLLVDQMASNMVDLALQIYGCRVIQKALEVSSYSEQLRLINELHGHVLKFVVDQNGNHVLQKCIEIASCKSGLQDAVSSVRVDGNDIQFVVDSFVGQAFVLSTHAYGCRVIQRILEHCFRDQIRPIFDEIIGRCRDLVKDQFGNYVIQNVLDHGSELDRSMIKKTIFPDVISYSHHKYASNVVEKCLDHATREEIHDVIERSLFCDESGNPCPLLSMMKDDFANYVVQKLMQIAQSLDQERIFAIVRHNTPYLRRFTFGKHVLARVEKDFGSAYSRASTVSGTSQGR